MVLRGFLLLQAISSILCENGYFNGMYFGAASALYIGMDHFKVPCYKYECCTVGRGRVHWIHNDVTKLDTLLEKKLFGQHIATKILHHQLGAFLLEPKPEKPFVVHISGKTGTGKNHISNLIAQARYAEGVESKYILKIIGTHKYGSLDHDTATKLMKKEVAEHVRKCKHALVIIDEAEKLPEGTLNAISPYLDKNVAIDGVDYRNTIFVFLSNTAGNAIRNYTETQLEAGRQRENIAVLEMENLIQEHLYNSGELKHSSLISRYQLDAFIPMLPLEKRHVQQCAEEQLKQRRNKCGCGDDPSCISTRANEIANQIDYSGRFSRSGCKKISTKANLVCPLDRKSEL